MARLRIHGGEPRPDPAFLTGTIDLAALENGGGDVVDCSNRFYSSPRNILGLGRARHMGEGWENARRRDDDNDHVVVRLAGEGMIDHVEIDTSYFVGNAPGWARLTGILDESTLADDSAWVTLVPRAELLPDCRHRFRWMRTARCGTCGSTCTRTAASRGCGCTADSCETSPPPGIDYPDETFGRMPVTGG